MKKVALLLSLAVASIAANAQVTLSGTSYTQDFNSIGSGLPAGWSIYTNATSTSLGTDASSHLNAAQLAKWNSTTGQFRNVASANAFAYYGGNDSIAQAAATDRALAVRQVGSTSSTFPNSDPGAAFVFEIQNTNGFTNFNLSFKLQSLDSTSTRTTMWQVDYAFGANPSTFTLASATGTLSTGGTSYTNNTVNVNFGSALDNQAGPIWIRITTAGPSTGSGNRATTGIDDFNLGWTMGTSLRPQITALSPANGTANLPVSSNILGITFNRGVQKGTGNIRVTNETDATTQTIAVADTNVSVTGNMVMVNNISLSANKMYHVTFDSTAFDTSSFLSAGIYDTTQWAFNTNVPTFADSLNETFDAACAAGHLPAGWSQYSVLGTPTWHCNTSYGYQGTAGIQINGYTSSMNTQNEDWLITPELDLHAMTNAYIAFMATKEFTGADLSVLVSHDYDGTSNPDLNATWLPVTVNFATADSDFHSFNGNITSMIAQPLYIAFKYTSTTSDGARWTVDNVSVVNNVSVANVHAATLPLTVLGYSTKDQMTLGYSVKEAGEYNLSIYDITGRIVYNHTINAQIGAQRMTINGLNLASGMYIVKMNNATTQGVVKTVVE